MFILNVRHRESELKRAVPLAVRALMLKAKSFSHSLRRSRFTSTIVASVSLRVEDADAIKLPYPGNNDCGNNIPRLASILEHDLHEGLEMGILGFLFILLVAASCAHLAKYINPEHVPGGFITSAIAATIGAWVGGSLICSSGPDVAGVSVIPCILGAAFLVLTLSLCSRGLRGRTASASAQ
jgi:uncharacterized membrane protein YeaQ/YmgE (transglycosylase-associated protein family)